MPRFVTRVVACLAASAIALGMVACSDGRPSKDELRETLSSRMITESMSEEERKATEATVDCFVGELHKDMSADGLKVLIAAAKNPEAVSDPEQVLSEKDLTVLAEAGAKCTAEGP